MGQKRGYVGGSNRLGGPADDDFDYDAHLTKPTMPVELDEDAPPAKKPRKTKAKAKAAEDPAEKRGARFKGKAPKASIERADRALSQRMFCVERTEVTRDAAGVPSQQFKIVGSAGNLYTVKVGLVPTCNCPDAAKVRVTTCSVADGCRATTASTSSSCVAFAATPLIRAGLPSRARLHSYIDRVVSEGSDQERAGRCVVQIWRR